MSPPRNANAPLAKGRRDELVDGGAYHVCSHSAIVTEQMPRGHVHHAREVCADCCAFLRWLPKPETVERQRMNAYRLARLAVCADLNTWQRNFIRDMSQRRRLSPRQKQIVDELTAIHLKGEAV